MRSDPPADWTPRVERSTDTRSIAVKVVEGSPLFRLDGLHGKDAGATGLAIDLGDGAEQWVCPFGKPAARR